MHAGRATGKAAAASGQAQLCSVLRAAVCVKESFQLRVHGRTGSCRPPALLFGIEQHPDGSFKGRVNVSGILGRSRTGSAETVAVQQRMTRLAGQQHSPCITFINSSEQ